MLRLSCEHLLMFVCFIVIVQRKLKGKFFTLPPINYSIKMIIIVIIVFPVIHLLACIMNRQFWFGAKVVYCYFGFKGVICSVLSYAKCYEVPSPSQAPWYEQS